MNAAPKISPLQLYRARTLPTGMAESSHLSQAYLTRPTLLESAFAFAFGYDRNESVLQMLTGGIGNTLEIDNREYTWELNGQNKRTVAISRVAPDASTPATDKPGYGGVPFRLYFAEKLFEKQDVLNADDGVQVRVTNEPYPDGSDWCYEVVLATYGTTYMDPYVLQRGNRFNKDYTTVSENSQRGSGVSFQTGTRLVNHLTTIRKTYGVTRSAATDVMIVELTARNGKKSRLWTKLLEWQAYKEWMEESETLLIYSTFSKDSRGEEKIMGENGRAVYHGAGMRQQISPANIRYYNKLTYEVLQDFLIDLSYAAKTNGGHTKFVAFTGKMGMVEFHNAIVAQQKALGITVTDSGTFITGKGQSLTLQGQFTTVKFLNGIELTVREFPPYDDTVRHRTLHPISQKPIESYRFTLVNFGTVADGSTNIRKVAKKKSENAMWYVAGSMTPFGDVAGSMNVMRSSGIDGYEVHFLSEIGLQVQDPTCCGELILDLNY